MLFLALLRSIFKGVKLEVTYPSLLRAKEKLLEIDVYNMLAVCYKMKADTQHMLM